MLSPDATGRAAATSAPAPARPGSSRTASSVALASTCTYLPCTRTQLQHHIFSRFLMDSIHLNSSTHVSFHSHAHPACRGWLSGRAKRLNFGALTFVFGDLELEEGHHLLGAAMQGSSNDTPVSFRIRERASHQRTCTRTGREQTDRRTGWCQPRPSWCLLQPSLWPSSEQHTGLLGHTGQQPLGPLD